VIFSLPVHAQRHLFVNQQQNLSFFTRALTWSVFYLFANVWSFSTLSMPLVRLRKFGCVLSKNLKFIQKIQFFGVSMITASYYQPEP
jgi:hypothetical protein